MEKAQCIIVYDDGVTSSAFGPEIECLGRMLGMSKNGVGKVSEVDVDLLPVVCPCRKCRRTVCLKLYDNRTRTVLKILLSKELCAECVHEVVMRQALRECELDMVQYYKALFSLDRTSVDAYEIPLTQSSIQERSINDIVNDVYYVLNRKEECWDHKGSLMLHLQDEVREYCREATPSGNDCVSYDRLQSEMGDILFTAFYESQRQQIDPFKALDGCLQRLLKRLRFIMNTHQYARAIYKQPVRPRDRTLLWKAAKQFGERDISSDAYLIAVSECSNYYETCEDDYDALKAFGLIVDRIVVQPGEGGHHA